MFVEMIFHHGCLEKSLWLIHTLIWFGHPVLNRLENGLTHVQQQLVLVVRWSGRKGTSKKKMRLSKRLGPFLYLITTTSNIIFVYLCSLGFVLLAVFLLPTQKHYTLHYYVLLVAGQSFWLLDSPLIFPYRVQLHVNWAPSLQEDHSTGQLSYLTRKQTVRTNSALFETDQTTLV